MRKAVSLQLETLPFEIDGHTYPLVCNMNVLEKLQNGPAEGDFGKLLELPSFKLVFEIFLAMVEDACETNPDLPVPDPKKLKRMFNPTQLSKAGLVAMFTRAISPDTVSDPDTSEKTSESQGN